MFARSLAAARQFFSGLFFYPDSEDFGTPADRGLPYEDVHFPSGADTLHGFLIRARGASKGVVLHCHGNAGNVSSHIPLVIFLVEAGYDVLTFDYAGFGASTGRPSLEGIENDARAALTYLLSRPDLPTTRVAVFGQSLGGAAASACAASPAVRCLVLEATFTTFRHIAWAKTIGRLLFFLVPGVIPDSGPERHLPAFAPRPLLLVHGEADTMVPARFSRRLHRLFPKNSTLKIIPLVGHLAVGADQTTPFAEAILTFLDEHLAFVGS